MNTIDIELLIEEVHKHPALWDPSCILYKHREARTQAWNEICLALVPNYHSLSAGDKVLMEKQVHQRWRNTRDSYVRSKTPTKTSPPNSGKKKYRYSDKLKFLDKTHEDSTASQSICDETQESVKEERQDTILTTDEQQDTKPESSASESPITVQTASRDSRKRRVSFLRKRRRLRDDVSHFERRQMYTVLKENIKILQNDDISFFHSLLPILQPLSSQQKLQFRSEVLKIAMNLSKDSSSSSDDSHSS